ncbi:MAG: RarD protein superfamily transporter [Nocardioidaceae bacterium]|nr:RarD protein superfamily transporter [Nocardioidaceae bacterium]
MARADYPRAVTDGEQGTAPSESARGFAMGASAYVLWGSFPLFWPLLSPSGALEVLAHRIVWSVVVMGVLLVGLRRVPQFRTILRTPRQRRLLVLAALVVTLNWGGYIYGVTHGKVVETSLGYFINPLVTVLMGVFVLGERLRPWQWFAIGLAGTAVVGLTVEYGRPPWIALLLAFSFGTYGLAKKQAGVEAVESLAFETAVLAPVALGYLVWLGATGRDHLTGYGAGHVLLLMSTGVVTAVPLLLFGAAAIRVPMTTLGLLQYLAPVIQFVIGVTVAGEAMTPWRYAGFALVWLALVIFTVEALRHRRRQLRLTALASAV